MEVTQRIQNWTREKDGGNRYYNGWSWCCCFWNIRGFQFLDLAVCKGYWQFKVCIRVLFLFWFLFDPWAFHSSYHIHHYWWLVWLSLHLSFFLSILQFNFQFEWIWLLSNCCFIFILLVETIWFNFDKWKRSTWRDFSELV